ncbi:hypothetical protein PA27867_1250 [Cryobacterium arcticum]|uniref:TNase-like domain-containing protein n=2 Tax=Cryobacterium arcticum TaxID=670052 RepID=A0A1B1BI54_9MICO|nr:hypothetical protein PA27867_1250 [Cryobacterium arcticum]
MSDEAPECGAQQAADYLEEFLQSYGDADQLTLTFDAQADRTDRFGRSLAYVQVNDAAGTDVALALATRGLAEAWYPRGEPEPERYGGYAGA